MPLPLFWLDRAVMEEVPLELWRALFDAVGWPTSLTGSRETCTHADISEAFTHDEPTDAQLHLLDALHSLGTPEGADAIHEALEDQRLPVDRLPTGVGARELAAQLFLAQLGDASLERVFARAQMQVQERRAPQRYHEFLSTKPGRADAWSSAMQALESDLLAYCTERDLGDHVQVRSFEDDGVYVCQILHTHRTQNPLAMVRGHSARATLAFRPVHCDHVEYDLRLGRLRIAARSPSMVAFYRRTFGRLLFADEQAFDGDAVCTLRPLQVLGRRALDHPESDIGRVWMTECVWERGDREQIVLRGRDCFDQIDALNLPFTEGQLVSAKLKVQVAGASMRPATVTIRTPSRIEITPPHHEAVINRLLSRLGLRERTRAGTIPTLWSLAPWRHSVDVWRAVFGRATDVLIEHRALERIQLESVTALELSDAGRVLTAHDVGNGEFYGTSQEPEVPSRTLTATDLDGFALVPDRFREWLRAHLGLSGISLPWAPSDEVLDLGTLAVGEHTLHLLYALRCPTAGLPDRLRTRIGGTPAVVLCPSVEPVASTMKLAPLDAAIVERADIIRLAVYAAGIEGQVPAVHIAPSSARLIVDPRRGMIWVDGHPILEITADSNNFRYVLMVAEVAPQPIERQRIKDVLSGASQDDHVVRKAQTAVNQAIARALTAAGVTLEAPPFAGHSKGTVRCQLPCFVGAK